MNPESNVQATMNTATQPFVQNVRVSPFVAIQGSAIDRGINGTTAVLVMLLGLAGIGADIAFPNKTEDSTPRFEFFSIACSYLVILSQAQLFDCLARSSLVVRSEVFSDIVKQVRKARLLQVTSGVLALVYATILACSNYCHDPDNLTYGELTIGSCHGKYSVASSNITVVLSFYVFLNFIGNLFEAYQPYLLLPSFNETSFFSIVYTIYGMIIHPAAAILFTNIYPEPDFAKFSVALVTNDEDSQETINNYKRQMATLFLLFNATDQINGASDGICNAIRKNTASDALAIFSLFFIKLIVLLMAAALVYLSIKAHEYRANMSGDVGEPYGATAPSTLGIFGMIVIANAFSKILYAIYYYVKEFDWSIFGEKRTVTRSQASIGPSENVEYSNSLELQNYQLGTYPATFINTTNQCITSDNKAPSPL